MQFSITDHIHATEELPVSEVRVFSDSERVDGRDRGRSGLIENSNWLDRDFGCKNSLRQDRQYCRMPALTPLCLPDCLWGSTSAVPD